ncbi:MAG: phage Gp19/Gp15/Gp42 family protein [Clostridiales Family XIII bacterium]|jgi:hypothetical protein|nr:phage Gp19/Gp15/Gp42 family protein [Clostridiales Family XIII bacterium]
MPDPFAATGDIAALWRPLTGDEITRANALLPVVSDTLRQAAKDVDRDLDAMIESGDILANVVKSVTVDVVARTLLTSTADEPLTQFSQGAGGYTVSGSFLVPGGGLFIKREELRRLGILHRQRMTMIDADMGAFDEKPNQGN